MKTKEKKGRVITVILPILGMLTGLLLLLIPFLIDRSNALRNQQAISSMTSVYDRYEENASLLSEQIEQAAAYNASLAGLRSREGIWSYSNQLSFDGGGVMGYLTIPVIDLQILIYHGTEDETLAVGAGHLEGTSLPVGGVSSHCVLTAHSGMSSMRAFDDIRKLKKGDLFAACVYGKSYVYEVDRIETVLPYETDSLQIVPGEDRMTLVTCTPYGINDHRLLVHGVRTERTIESEEGIRTKPEGTSTQENAQVRIVPDLRTIPLFFAILIVAAVIIFIGINWTTERRKKRK